SVGDLTVDTRLGSLRLVLGVLGVSGAFRPVVASRVLVVDLTADPNYVAHERYRFAFILQQLGRILGHESAAQVDLQAPNALLTGTEREGQVRAVATDVDVAAEGKLVLDGELAAENRSCRNVRAEAQREDGRQGKSRKALHPCVPPAVSRVSRPSRWPPKGSPASGQCFLAD